MYANTGFLMGIWERAVRDWMGPGGQLTALRGFRMGRFNLVGGTVTVRGTVTATDHDTDLVTLRMHCEDAQGTTAGPGEVDIRLPLG